MTPFMKIAISNQNSRPFTVPSMRLHLYFLMASIFLISAVSFLWPTLCKSEVLKEAYWLWAGITENLAPTHSDLYIYQGIITNNSTSLKNQHQGLYPYPISCKKCTLVYRLNTPLPEARQIVAVFLKDAKKWERHQVVIEGLQIDYDSPTARLAPYSQFLAETRKYLPSKYKLDITGLCDWITAGNTQPLEKIAGITEDIVFQLYDNRHPLPYASYYIQALKRYPYPFRLGVLQTFPLAHEISPLKKNPHFLGIIYFIQRD